MMKKKIKRSNDQCTGCRNKKQALRILDLPGTTFNICVSSRFLATRNSMQTTPILLPPDVAVNKR